MRKIKLIWDFRGPESAKTAEHHKVHLTEYLQAEKRQDVLAGFEVLSDVYAIAFIVVDEVDMILFRDALRPHRGEVYE